MRRELLLLLAEIVDAAERIVELTAGATLVDLDTDRTRREALLWRTREIPSRSVARARGRDGRRLCAQTPTVGRGDHRMLSG